MWAKKEIRKRNGGKKIVFQTRVKFFFLPPPLREKKLLDDFLFMREASRWLSKKCRSLSIGWEAKGRSFPMPSKIVHLLLLPPLVFSFPLLNCHKEAIGRKEGMEGRRERQLTQSNPSSPYTYFFLHSTSSSSVRQQQCEEKLAGIVPTNLVRVPKLNLSLSLNYLLVPLSWRFTTTA